MCCIVPAARPFARGGRPRVTGGLSAERIVGWQEARRRAGVRAYDAKDLSSDVDTFVDSFEALDSNPVANAQQFAGLGDQLPALGYLDQPDLAARKFVDHDGERLYQAGCAAPSFRSRIPGRGIIEGSFTKGQAEDLVEVLRSKGLQPR